MKTVPVFIQALILVLLIALPAAAGNPANSGIVGSAMHAETAYDNPAGMVRIQETTKTLGGTFAYSLSEFDVNENKTSVDGGDHDSDHTPIVIPAFYYVRPVKENWRLGFSMNVPSGFGSDYGNDWAGRYYADSFALVYVGLTPSVAYRIDEHWSVGVSFNITYNYSETDVRINNPGPNQPDGKMEFDADDIGYTGTFALMYQWNDKTRIGVNYTGETDTTIEGDIKFKGLGPVLEPLLGPLHRRTLKVDTIMPQRVAIGAYHEYDSGLYFTLDTFWIDFSEFGTGDISVEGGLIIEPEGIYQDMRGVTMGFGFPLDQDTTWKFGAMYMSSGVENSDRTLSLPLDRIWAVGTGVSQKLKDSTLDINFNLYNLGDSPVDTGTSSPLRGRVVGKSDTPYALALDVSWHW